MGIITQSGTLNTASLVVPDLYVQIQTNGSTSLSGAQTNVIGVVGTASWGPVNTPLVFGTSAERIVAFGPMQTNQFDLATVVSTAILQGASSFVGVRVTDGTDAAASAALLADENGATYPVLLSARYTGTSGNTITAALSAGSALNTWKLTVSMPNSIPETFDNIAVGSAPADFWAALVSAVNNGVSNARGPSNIVVAALGAETSVVPTAIANITLVNGKDGNTGVVAENLVGTDGVTRTGMYALRGQDCSIGVLSGVTDSSTWSVQVAFGVAEGLYMISGGPAGQAISDALASRTNAGADSYALKVMFGDWIYWYDSENSLTRLVSPAGFVAGRLASLSPQLPSLNKQLYGIVGSQKSGLTSTGQTLTYSSSELSSLFENGFDVISNPAPGGSYWTVRGGFNFSSNSEIDGDEYTRVTNFIARTISDGMGIYIGEPISPTLFRNIEATLTGFLSDLQSQGVIGTEDGSVAYSVTCSSSNNPQSRVALGFVQADVSVTYLGVNRKFIVNIDGGADVTVASAS